jgi:hypothetical protein
MSKPGAYLKLDGNGAWCPILKTTPVGDRGLSRRSGGATARPPGGTFLGQGRQTLERTAYRAVRESPCESSFPYFMQA